MKTLPRSMSKTTRIATTLALLVLAGGAWAANPGSTDTWGNQFKASFGEAARSQDATAPANRWNGSTDVWANRLQESFGATDPARSQSVSGVGSTDTWGAYGFRHSFVDTTSAGAPIGMVGRSALR